MMLESVQADVAMGKNTADVFLDNLPDGSGFSSG